ncbi:MAG: hypothetical protein JXR95_03395 [Deltaproteobacteria bacterium]|nr:hypothetical protein [Deltaproteobacteria bacterium]
MRILISKPKKDCLDKELIWDYVFDSITDSRFLEKLSLSGVLELFTDFPRPFFRFSDSSGMQIKGILGTTSCTVFFSKTNKPEQKDFFEQLISNLEN